MPTVKLTLRDEVIVFSGAHPDAPAHGDYIVLTRAEAETLCRDLAAALGLPSASDALVVAFLRAEASAYERIERERPLRDSSVYTALRLAADCVEAGEHRAPRSAGKEG